MLELANLLAIQSCASVSDFEGFLCCKKVAILPEGFPEEPTGVCETEKNTNKDYS